MLKQLVKSKASVAGNLGYKDSKITEATFTAFFADEVMDTTKLAMIIRYVVLNDFNQNGSTFSLSASEINNLKSKISSDKVKTYYEKLPDSAKKTFAPDIPDRTNMDWDNIKDVPPFLINLYLNYLAVEHQYVEVIAISLYVYASKGGNISSSRFDKICQSFKVTPAKLSHTVIRELVMKLPKVTDDIKVNILHSLRTMADSDNSLSPLVWLVNQAAYPNIAHHMLIAKFLSSPALTGIKIWRDIVPQNEVEAFTRQATEMIANPFRGFNSPAVPRAQVKTLFALAASMLDIIEGERSTWLVYAPIGITSVSQVSQFVRDFKTATTSVLGASTSMGIIQALLGKNVKRNAQGEVVEVPIVPGQPDPDIVVNTQSLKDQERCYVNNLHDDNYLKKAINKAVELTSELPTMNANLHEDAINKTDKFWTDSLDEGDIWTAFGLDTPAKRNAKRPYVSSHYIDQAHLSFDPTAQP